MLQQTENTEERLARIIENTRKIAGRTLTTDKARELARIADSSVRRERF